MQSSFFHIHSGCLDAHGECHAFCFSTVIRDADGSTELFDTCPDRESHPDGCGFPDLANDDANGYAVRDAAITID